MRKYVLDKKWTSGSSHSYIMVEATTKKEVAAMDYVYNIGRPLIKSHPEIAGFFYGEYLLDSPSPEEVFFLRKVFSLGNRARGALRAAKWLHRHNLEAGYDPASGRIRVWHK